MAVLCLAAGARAQNVINPCGYQYTVCPQKTFNVNSTANAFVISVPPQYGTVLVQITGLTASGATLTPKVAADWNGVTGTFHAVAFTTVNGAAVGNPTTASTDGLYYIAAAQAVELAVTTAGAGSVTVSYSLMVPTVGSLTLNVYGSPAAGATAIICPPNIITSAAIGCPVAPSAPQSLAAGTATSTTIPLTWTAPATGNPATYTYIASYALHGTGSYTVAASGITGLSYTITGLTASTAYDVQVTANNQYATGPAATLSNVSTASGGGLPNNYVADGAGGYVSDGAGGVVLAQ